MKRRVLVSNEMNTRRRRFLRTAAVSFGAMELSLSGLAHAQSAGGIGHNLPQEAPKAFADAVIEVAIY